MSDSNKSVPTRSQVKLEETWDVTVMFANLEAWDEAFAQLPKEQEVNNQIAKQFLGRLSESPQKLAEALEFRANILRKIEKFVVYARLRQDEDQSHSAAAERVARIEALSSNIIASFSFMEPEILQIKDLATWITTPQLKSFRFPLEETLRSKEHILGAKEEQIIAKLQLPLTRFADTYRRWKNVDLQFPAAVDSHGQEHIVSNARYAQLLQSRDRTLRKSAFESYFAEHRKWRNTIATNYFGCLQAGSIEAQLRGFGSYREAELFKNDVSVSVYDGLIDCVRQNLHTFHDSVTLRRQMLEVDKVEHWDRAVSISDTKEFSFTWKEAVDLILESLAPMGSEYIAIAKRGLTTDRWVDYAENVGKRAGAYSWGCYDSRPYILMSWTSSVRDVFTLAHELGHSMHTYLTNQTQPYHLSSYKIFVAEVASTFHEILLSNHILRTMPNSDLARRVVVERVQGFEGTVLRQTLFATFEREAAKLVDANEAITPDALDQIFANLTQEWHGPSYRTNPLMANEWMLVPHFYSPFYVYQYATSQCASEALAEHMRQSPQEGLELYMRFVKAGASKTPLQILMDAGVDLTKPQPITNAFASYERNLATARQMLRGS